MSKKFRDGQIIPQESIIEKNVKYKSFRVQKNLFTDLISLTLGGVAKIKWRSHRFFDVFTSTYFSRHSGMSVFYIHPVYIHLLRPYTINNYKCILLLSWNYEARSSSAVFINRLSSIKIFIFNNYASTLLTLIENWIIVTLFNLQGLSLLISIHIC